MEKLACSRFWTDINLNINRKELVNCCKRTQSIPPSLEEIQTLGLDLWSARPSVLEEKRQMVEDNIFPEGCKACARTHPHSQWNVWNLWKGKPDSFYTKELITEDKTNYIAISLSSTCNQACLYCNAEVSSMWAKKLGIEPVEAEPEYKQAILDSLYNYIDVRVAPVQQHVKYNFLGGETFLDYSFFDVIETLSEIHTRHRTPKVTMELISNLNVKPAVIDKFLDVTRRYSNIDWIISGSVENLGIRAESSRVELDFNLFEENLDKIIAQENIRSVQILPTMNLLSIADHAEFLDWVFDKFSNTRGIQNILRTWGMTINSVTYGELDVGHAPKSFGVYLDAAKDKITRIADQIENEAVAIKVRMYNKHLDDIKERLGTLRSQEKLARSKSFMDKQVLLHGIDYWTIYPELADVYTNDILLVE